MGSGIKIKGWQWLEKMEWRRWGEVDGRDRGRDEKVRKVEKGEG